MPEVYSLGHIIDIVLDIMSNQSKLHCLIQEILGQKTGPLLIDLNLRKCKARTLAIWVLKGKCL